MQGPESSKTYLAPKEPSVERAYAAVDRVLHFRDGQGRDLPVAARLVDGSVVMQIGLNPAIEMVLTPEGSGRLGDVLTTLSGQAVEYVAQQRCADCGEPIRNNAVQRRRLYHDGPEWFHQACWASRQSIDREAAGED